jgi:hypothetical protein
MKHEASEANQKVAKIRDFEYCIMTLFSTTLDAFVCEIYEHEIRQGIDELGGVVRGIVVLVLSVPSTSLTFSPFVPLHTIGASR